MQRFGLLGQSLEHSYSPMIHKALGTCEDYALFEVKPDELDTFMRRDDWQGINITIPYKQAVMPYCDELSVTAQAIGSVNTIVRHEDGSLFGDNTDAAGFAAMLRHIDVQGKKVLILGSGGSSLAVKHVLCKALPQQVVTISRNGEDNYGNLDRHFNAQVIVNTTPLGMYPNVGTSAVAVRDFPHLQGVLDLIYNPARTALLLDAEERGIACMGGLPMLVGQAAAASELFTRRKVSADKEREVLRSMQRKMENIIIVGMPGSGKSVIARTLANRLGRTVIDTDEEVTKITGITPGEMIAAQGEEAFRKCESEVLAEFGKQSGLVISTGGGVVTREENYRLLRQNGRIVFLERPLKWLARKGRPLSQGDLNTLYRKRLPLYRDFADFTVKNVGRREEVVDEIIGH